MNKPQVKDFFFLKTCACAIRSPDSGPQKLSGFSAFRRKILTVATDLIPGHKSLLQSRKMIFIKLLERRIPTSETVVLRVLALTFPLS